MTHKIYEMKIHESILLGRGVLVTKVHSGWLYEYEFTDGTGGYRGNLIGKQVIFVPETPSAQVKAAGAASPGSEKSIGTING